MKGKTDVHEEFKTTIEDKIFANRLVLDERYDPDIIYHREEETREIINFFKEATLSSGNIDIVGTTGTGKTLSIRRIMNTYTTAMKDQKIRCVYINCRDNNTCSRVLTETARLLTGDARISHYTALDALNRTIESSIAIILILDEIDIILEKEDDRLLYVLSNKPKISIINISNNPGWRKLIRDQRVISRMPPNQILFSPYGEDELFDILNSRAETGLRKGTYTPDIIHEISRYVAADSGDMRIALKILKKAGEKAIQDGKSEITINEINQIKDRVGEIDLAMRYISRLPLPKKAILLAIFDYNKRRHKQPTLSDIYESYDKMVSKSTILNKLAQDTIGVYLTELSTYRLIESMGGKGRGRGRGRESQTYKLAINEELFETEFYSKCVVK